LNRREYFFYWKSTGAKVSETVGIIGLGSVGAAVEAGMNSHFEIVGWDIDGRGSLSGVLCSDIVFICVQTDGLDTNLLDVSAVFSSVKELDQNRYKGLIVIKSTLQVGTMDSLQQDFPNLKLCYMPEYLREKDAIEWFQNPDRLILSGEKEVCEIVLSYFGWVEESVPRLFMSHVEAELSKLAHNAFIATKVTFTCEIERLSLLHGANPMSVMKGIWVDRRINNPAHLTPGLGGYDGKCVPKDTASLTSIDPDRDSLLHQLQKRGSKSEVENRMRREGL
jgi:UDPglucose 6-dehydrogenase